MCAVLHGSKLQDGLLQGEKWSSTKWLHVSSLIDGSAAGTDSGDEENCHDADGGCEDWAWAEECEWQSNHPACNISHNILLAVWHLLQLWPSPKQKSHPPAACFAGDNNPSFMLSK